MTENLDNNDQVDAAPVEMAPITTSFFRRVLTGFIGFSERYQLFKRIFTVLFTLLVFGLVFRYTKHNRDALSYFGIMLMMTVIYIEMLVIRDHLWVLEGSMRQGKQWRDLFFSEKTLRMQRFRKIFIVLFSAAIFTYVYWNHWNQKGTEIFSFLGIILMVTVIYFEILTVRDELRLIETTLKAMGLANAGEVPLGQKAEESLHTEVEEQSDNSSAEPDNSDESVVPTKGER